MPDDEGLALHAAGRAAAADRPAARDRDVLREVRDLPRRGGARGRARVLFTVDHHRGSEENQAGWEHHDERLVDPRTGRMDTLPFFRRTIEDAGPRGRRDRGHRRVADRRRALGDAARAACSSTAATRSTSPWPTTRAGRATSPRAACLVFHDVFDDPADGGQAPYRGVAARGRRRLHARLDDRQPPRPPRPRLTAPRLDRAVPPSQERSGERSRARSSSISTPAASSSSALRPSGSRSPRNSPAVGPVAGERVRGQHHRGRVPRRLLDRVELAVGGGTRSSSKLAPVQ